MLLIVVGAIALGEKTDLVLAAEQEANLVEQDVVDAWKDNKGLALGQPAPIGRLFSFYYALSVADRDLGRKVGVALTKSIEAATIRAAAKLLTNAQVEDICSIHLRPYKVAVSAWWVAVSQATMQIEYDLEKLCKRLKGGQKML